MTTVDTSLDPSLLSSVSSLSTASTRRILRLNSNDAKPCLTPTELSRVDAVLTLLNEKPRVDSRSKVLLKVGSPNPFPLIYSGKYAVESAKYFNFESTRRCAGCNKSFKTIQLKACEFSFPL